MKFLNVLLENVIVLVVYDALALVGVEYTRPGSSSLLLLWLPAGIGLSALILKGRRVLPGIFLASLTVSLPFFYQPGASHWLQKMIIFGVVVSLVRAGQSVLGHFLYTEHVGESGLHQSRGVLRFFWYAVLFPVITSAFLVELIFGVGGYIAAGSTGEMVRMGAENWLSICLSDIHGLIALTPIVVGWVLYRKQRKYRRDSEILYFALWGVYLALMAGSIFLWPNLFFLLLALALFMTFVRNQVLSNAILIFLTSLGYTAATVKGVGPFADLNPWLSMIELPLAVFSIAITLLFVSAKLRELQDINQSLDTTIQERSRELSRVNEQLVENATLDPLTGLYNRRHFMEMAKKEISRAMRYGDQVGILVIDLDGFKAINNTYGQAVGDVILCEFASLARKILRPYDVLARLGGDDFVLLLPHTTPDQALSVAERIRVTVREHQVHYQEMIITFTVSIGVSEVFDQIDQALSEANRLLIIAKQSGNSIETAVMS